MKMIIFVPASFVKKTSIGLCTNFTSFTTFLYKIGLIKTLLHRGFEISSSWTFSDQEKQTITNLSIKNFYPSYLIDEKSFLEKLLRKTPILFITRKSFFTKNYHTLVLFKQYQEKHL